MRLMTKHIGTHWQCVQQLKLGQITNQSLATQNASQIYVLISLCCSIQYSHNKLSTRPEYCTWLPQITLCLCVNQFIFSGDICWTSVLYSWEMKLLLYAARKNVL